MIRGDYRPDAGRLARPVRTHDGDAWDAVERLAAALERSPRRAADVPRVLEATHEALAADAVVWHPGFAPDAPQVVGVPAPDRAWCHAFVRAMRGRVRDGGEVVAHFLDPAARPMTPWPVSAALLRVRKLEALVAESVGADRAALATELAAARTAVRAEKLGEVAAEFDRVHSVQRAVDVGSVDAIISAAELRPKIIEAIERGLR